MKELSKIGNTSRYESAVQPAEDILTYVAQQNKDFPLIPPGEVMPRRKFLSLLPLRFPQALLDTNVFKVELHKQPRIENIGQIFSALNQMPSLIAP